MYVAPIFDRLPPIDTGFPSDAQTRADRLDRERREFIRAAAIELYASGECVLSGGAWAAAEALWNARPEGC